MIWIKHRPSVLQQPMDSILSGLLGVGTYLDNILTVAISLEQLRECTAAVLQDINDNIFHLRPENAGFL